MPTREKKRKEPKEKKKKRKERKGKRKEKEAWVSLNQDILDLEDSFWAFEKEQRKQKLGKSQGKGKEFISLIHLWLWVGTINDLKSFIDENGVD